MAFKDFESSYNHSKRQVESSHNHGKLISNAQAILNNNDNPVKHYLVTLGFNGKFSTVGWSIRIPVEEQFVYLYRLREGTIALINYFECSEETAVEANIIENAYALMR